MGIILILVLSGFLDSIGIEKFQFYVGVGMGAGVGFMQWIMIRNISEIKLEWLWTSILGLGIPFLFLDFWSQYSGYPLGDKYLSISIASGSVLWVATILCVKETFESCPVVVSRMCVRLAFSYGNGPRY